MKRCGCTTQGVRKMFEVPPSECLNFPNPCRKSFTALTHDIHAHQLYPGKNLDSIGILFAQFFRGHLQQENISTKYTYTGPGWASTGAISLWTMCSKLLVDSAQTIYFGSRLSIIDPGLAETFLHFDKVSWQLLFQMPHLLSRDMHHSKDRIVNAMDSYLRIPSEQRPGAAWEIGILEGEMRQLGLLNRDIAKMMMILYWGSVPYFHSWPDNLLTYPPYQHQH